MKVHKRGPPNADLWRTKASIFAIVSVIMRVTERMAKESAMRKGVLGRLRIRAQVRDFAPV
jgi:hypothetical protein